MIKYSTKVFLLSAFAMIFTSSKGMNIKELAHKENISLECDSVVSSSEVSIPYGIFAGWYFKQICLEKNSIKKYRAACFAKNCTGQFETGDNSSTKKALIKHLEGHLKNATYGVVAQILMPLPCKDPIFSIKIKRPTLFLCRDEDGIFYHSYRCNKEECMVVQGNKISASALKHDCKVHLFYCYEEEINMKNILSNHRHRLKSCCFDARNPRLHVWNCHFKIEDER